MKTNTKIENAVKSDELLSSIRDLKRIDDYIDYLTSQQAADLEYLSRRFEDTFNDF